jgi:hypothetical protein
MVTADRLRRSRYNRGMSDDEKFRWIWYMTICAVFILVTALSHTVFGERY